MAFFNRICVRGVINDNRKDVHDNIDEFTITMHDNADQSFIIRVKFNGSLKKDIKQLIDGFFIVLDGELRCDEHGFYILASNCSLPMHNRVNEPLFGDFEEGEAKAKRGRKHRGRRTGDVSDTAKPTPETIYRFTDAGLNRSLLKE